MLDKEKIQIKVGIFVMAGLILAMYIIFMIGGESQLFRSQYTLKTTFKDISGLRVGAPVQLAGYKVGFVDSINFPKDLAKKEIELSLKIDKKFQDRIRSDSTATINTQGLLGDKFIYISVGSLEQPVLNNKEGLIAKDTVSIFNLVEKGGEIMDDVREASHSARKFFEDMYTSKEDVRSILHSMKSVIQQAENGEGLLHQLLYDPKGKEVVKKLASSMDSLDSIMSRADETDKKTGEVSGMLKDLRIASKEFKELVQRINRGEGTIGGLVNDPAMYNDMRSLFGRANRNKLLKSVVRSTLSENDKKVMK